jgi:uncharacterized tellurite resistance protein B-like protein
MLESIRQFFDRNLAPAAEDASAAEVPDGRRLALAACALMLELAYADDEFSDPERRHIEDTLVRHFALDPGAAQELMTLADEERKRSVDLYQFTSLITQSYDEGQRMVLAEVLWRLVYADGEFAAHESYLLRKLSSLLDLRPGYLAAARKRALGSSPGADG